MAEDPTVSESIWGYISDPFDIFHDEDAEDATLLPSAIALAGSFGITESTWRSFLPLNRAGFIENWERQTSEGNIPTVYAPVEVQGSWELIGESVAEEAVSQIGDLIEDISDPLASVGSLLDALKKYAAYIAIGAGVVLAVVVIK